MQIQVLNIPTYSEKTNLEDWFYKYYEMMIACIYDLSIILYLYQVLKEVLALNWFNPSKF